MANFGFVILHYLVSESTVECVSSIERCCNGAKIVIVDNNSANGSFEKLQKTYARDTAVSLLHNPSNEGFARGNNVGYSYARDVLHCDYIVTINNDAIVVSDDFMLRCENDAKANPRVGVIGPDIESGKYGTHSNPVYSVINTKNQINKLLCKFDFFLLLLHLHLWEPIAKIKKKLIRSNTNSIPEYMNYSPDEKRDEPFKLHGACLVFTPAFIERFNMPFDPGTFLYFEEDILLMRCEGANLTMMYDKNIQVKHAEDVSTDQMMENNKHKKLVFTLNNYVHSLRILKRYVKK